MQTCRGHLAAVTWAVLVTLAAASQTLIPSFPEGCPYIDTSCTRVELLPIKRNDTCHQNIAAGFAQEVAAADALQVKGTAISSVACSALDCPLRAVYGCIVY